MKSIVLTKLFPDHQEVVSHSHPHSDLSCGTQENPEALLYQMHDLQTARGETQTFLSLKGQVILRLSQG